MNRPLKEHFEVDTDVATMLRTFDYIEALEKYCDHLEQVKNCDLADVGGSAINIDELIKKMNKIRNDEAFKGVLSFDYPNEILEVIDALETLR
jgi:hypothetical protein